MASEYITVETYKFQAIADAIKYRYSWPATKTMTSGEMPRLIREIPDMDILKTKFTLKDGTVKTHDITGTLDGEWMNVNGYYDNNIGEWLKTITKADIGNAVTSIGDSAFRYCSELTSITIPDKVTSIGDEAFVGCSELTSITIPDYVTDIGNYAFSGCISLVSITIPSKLKNIGDNAFSGIGALTSITIPEVTSIGYQAFFDCHNLTSITIPDKVTSIGDEAFVGCTYLTSVTIVATGKPGASAANVKQNMINAGVSENIIWNMPN